MTSIRGAELADVTALYEGWQRRLFALLMGQQLHVGGFQSSMELADLAGIAAGSRGVDLCCGSGTSMRVLVRFREVASMIGVDATPAQIERGRRECEREGLTERVHFVLADACSSGLADREADFVWAEDAWCYVSGKEKLVAEAARIARPGGTIAFTDWVEGPTGLADAEAESLSRLLQFSNLRNLASYRTLLEKQSCDVLRSEDTGRLAPCLELYARMIDTQLGYDALEIVDFDRDVLHALQGQLVFLGELAGARKLAQARFVARRR
jgi:sarcosine/dimethylglycine N-methyltransferase